MFHVYLVRKFCYYVFSSVCVCVCAYTTLWQISNTYTYIHMCICMYSCVYGSYVNCITLNRQPSYFLAPVCITGHVGEDLINTRIWSRGSWWNLVGESIVRPMVEYMLGLKETTRQGMGLQVLWFQTGISGQCRPRGKKFSFTGISPVEMCRNTCLQCVSVQTEKYLQLQYAHVLFISPSFQDNYAWEKNILASSMVYC